MSLAFLHGEYLVGMMALGALAVLAVPAVALWWWRHPPRSPITPAAIYLSAAFVILVPWLSGSSNVLVAGLGFALALPWSALYFFGSTLFEVAIPLWLMLPGVLANAALIYGVAVLAGRRA